MSLQRSLIAHDHRPILDRLPSRIRFATGTTGTEPLYGVRISDELMGQIQKWGRENSATRSEAIRRLVELGLKKGK
jgi:hypothetical protein